MKKRKKKIWETRLSRKSCSIACFFHLFFLLLVVWPESLASMSLSESEYGFNKWYDLSDGIS
jgi:hypothetical protein